MGRIFPQKNCFKRSTRVQSGKSIFYDKGVNDKTRSTFLYRFFKPKSKSVATKRIAASEELIFSDVTFYNAHLVWVNIL